MVQIALDPTEVKESLTMSVFVGTMQVPMEVVCLSITCINNCHAQSINFSKSQMITKLMSVHAVTKI